MAAVETQAPPRLYRRLGRRYARPAVEGMIQWPRVFKYRVLSTCRRVEGAPIVLQPILLVGPGRIAFGDGVLFGWRGSPLFYTGYSHLEVATPSAAIEIGARTEFNNNVFLKSDGGGIRIGRDCLFGPYVEILDSDFHDTDPALRRSGSHRPAAVEIGDNVFVGTGARVLKGAAIGSDSVIGAGAVVTGEIPAGVVAAGNPARVVREL
ncbi:MAG TPA: DapH/DapD/GlmU-related protein [Solirubrobacterales bacterium]|nr:DapH/DapD/GlmU-related protein [Solirubrobacterales bacterium]